MKVVKCVESDLIPPAQMMQCYSVISNVTFRWHEIFVVPKISYKVECALIECSAAFVGDGKPVRLTRDRKNTTHWMLWLLKYVNTNHTLVPDRLSKLQRHWWENSPVWNKKVPKQGMRVDRTACTSVWATTGPNWAAVKDVAECRRA